MNIFKKHELVTRIPHMAIGKLENADVPFIYFILTFFFIITLRIFIDIYVYSIWISSDTIHHYLFYIGLALSLIIIFRLASNISLIKVSKVVLPCFIVLLIAPSLDWLISAGDGFKVTYLLPGIHSDLFIRFVTFFGDFPDCGVSPGMRIEIAFVLLASFTYFYVKTSRLIRSIGCTIVTYATIFTFGITPYIIKAIAELFGLDFTYSNILFTHFFVVIIFLLGLVTAFIGNKQYFIIIAKDIRLLRMLFYFSMFILGVSIGVSSTPFELSTISFFRLLLIPVSLFFAILFSIVTNNIADYEIDKLANPKRPLVKGKISSETYRKLPVLFLLLSMFYAAIVDYETVFAMTVFIGNYFMYSMPPLRLKRVTFLSKLAISVNSLVLVVLGNFMITGSLSYIPGITFPILLVGFTAMANMIDIKDYHGDKIAGIKTLPVVLGLTKAKIVIGLFFLVTYGFLFFVVSYTGAPLYWYYVILSLGVIQFFLINKKNYNENAVFAVILCTVWLVIFMITRY